MLKDDKKYRWSKDIGHVADRAGQIQYYNCWHCKRCGSELKRVCSVCGKEICDTPYGFWCDMDKGVIQICPFGCKRIGGLEMFVEKEKICNKDKYKKV